MTFFKSISVYFICTLLFILAGGLILLSTDKVDFHMWINQFHNSFFDFFFKYCTHVSDGITVAVLGFIFVFIVPKKYRWSTFVLCLSTLVLTGILSQFAKHFIFPEAFRPNKFIGDGILYLVDGVNVRLENSFPSGHTTAAFGFFALTSFLFARKKNTLQLLFFLFALLCGYSRMYLSQHFLEDVVAGAFLGIMSFGLAYMITRKIKFQDNITEQFSGK